MPAYCKDRGFIYQTTYVLGLFPGNGENGFTSSVLSPKDSRRDAWMYSITKTGSGTTIWEAFQNSLSANAMEVLKR